MTNINRNDVTDVTQDPVRPEPVEGLSKASTGSVQAGFGFLRMPNIPYGKRSACIWLLLISVFVFHISAIAAEEKAHDETENVTTISAQIAKAAGIESALAGAATIKKILTLFARVEVEPQALYAVSARYAGIVTQIGVMEGDSVTAGAPVAIIENNNTLQKYTVTAPAAGTVIRRNVNRGDATGGAPLLLIADLSQLMVELLVFPKDLQHIRVGQAVIATDAQQQTARATVEHIAPSSENNTTHIHASLGRVPATWQPGLAVNAEIVLLEQTVPLAVRVEAIQELDGKNVVFVQTGERYEVQEITLGNRDTQWVEVLGGLKAGARYVTYNSYLLKADIEKSAASHAH